MSDLGNFQRDELDLPTRFIRIGEVQHRTGLGRSTIYRWLAQGRIRKTVQLGGHIVT